MITVASHRNEQGGFELWQTMDGGFRLRTYHRTPSGVVVAPHAVTLTEWDVERLSERIMDFFYQESEFMEELEDLIHEEGGAT